MGSGGEQTKSAAASRGISVRAVIGLLILTNALVYQLSTLNRSGASNNLISAAMGSIGIIASDATATGSVRGSAGSSSASSRYALEIPQGEAVAMPSVRISEEESAKVDRKIFEPRQWKTGHFRFLLEKSLDKETSSIPST